MSEFLTVRPFSGLGGLSFGASREACRALLGSGWKEFSRSGTSDFTETDAFPELGLYLAYDDENRLRLIEAASPARVLLRGVVVLGRQLDDVVSELARDGVAAVEDDEGVQFPAEGLVLYAPNGTVEAASVYPKGYYD